MLQIKLKNKKNFFIPVAILAIIVIISLFIGIFHDDDKPIKRYMTKEIPVKNADINTAYDTVLPSSVRIESGDYMGSGNIWEITGSKIKVLTASHVAAQDSCNVTFFDGLSANGTVTFRDDVKDIAMIEVDSSFVKESKKKDSPSYRSVRPSKVLPDCEEKIFIIDTLTNSSSVGIVDTPSVFNPMIGHDVIYCMCEVEEGMSGSGLFDATGHYHGILLQKSDGACICLPVSDINIP